MNIKPIKSERDYKRALRHVEEVWDSATGSAESDELDVLATLIEAYERAHFPIDLPGPIEAIRFRLEQQGKDSRALVGVIGQRTRVYEVMQGKRPLSLNMIRSLHKQFGIPAEVLIQSPRGSRRSTGRSYASALRRRTMKKSA